MLQQNNNNNHPCLDMGHREMLHENRCRTAPFSSALELGTIPLITGLRAWAVSGGYSISRRKNTPQAPTDGGAGQRSWVSHRKMEDGRSSFQTPGFRQGGLGALVTVTTLKGSEGSRQTQTRCLFLKSEGCSYLCTVSNRAVGVGQRVHINLVNGKETTPGRRRSKDDMGVKPQDIPRWRKSSKVTRPLDKSLAAESKGSVAFSRLEQRWLEKRDSFTMQLAEQKDASTGTSAITQCLKNKHTLKNRHRTMHPGLANQNGQADGNKRFSYNKAHLQSSEHFLPPENFASAKANSNIGEQGLGTKPSNCVVQGGQEMPSLCSSGIDEATGTSHYKSGLVADANLCHTAKCKGTNLVSGVPKVKELSSGFRMLMQVTNKRNDDIEVKQKLKLSHGESSITHRNSPDNTEEEQEWNKKGRIGKDLLNCDSEKSVVAIHIGPIEKDEALEVGSTTYQGVDAGQYPKPAHSSQYVEEVDTKCETPGEKKLPKSPSRGSSFSKAAAAAVAATSLLNPAPSITLNGTGAIATALPDVSEQEEARADGNTVQLCSELLGDQKIGLEEDMVATNKRPIVTDEEEEDEFGVFVQAGEEQIWADGFKELQQVPCRKHDCSVYTNPSDANQPKSWTSNWSGFQTCQQSADSWTAFKQETREEEQEMAPEVQWWSSPAKDSTYHTLSSLHNVHRMFLEAFPCVQPPCGDYGCIPTLSELLWGAAEKKKSRNLGNLKPWDGLQDLDRMIDMKYKRAESMAHKLLLQSLHVGPPNSERVHVRRQAAARFSPNLPTSSQKLAANAKRRLSYDINRNIMA